MDNERERKSKTGERALSDLMKYASRAERSSGDVMRLMRTWNVPESERYALIERLMREGFIDDRRFAGAFVREKSRLAGWGVYKIMAGLRSKGVSKDVAAEALAVDFDGGYAARRLEEMLIRKAKTMKGGTKYEIKGKLMRFGLSRGYDYDAVSEAVEKAMPAESE